MPINMDRAKELMQKNELDALLASSPENFFYSTDLYIPFVDRFRGFTSGFGQFALIPVEGNPTMCVTELDADLAKEIGRIQDQRFTKTWAYFNREDAGKIHTYPETVSALVDVLNEKGLTGAKIGFEEKVLPIADYNRITKELPNVRFKDASNLFLQVRAVKIQEEINRMRRAAEISVHAFEAAFEMAREGATESELMGAFQQELIKQDGYIHKGLIHWNLTTGVHSATVRRGWPLDHKLQKGDVMRFDGGAIYKGYRCDMARARTLGSATEKVKRLYQALWKAEETMISMIKPGVPFSDLFKAGMKIVRDTADPNFERKHLGHGLGLITEEEPVIGPKNNSPIKENMVLSVEVPYYWTGVGGFNVEDVVLVTSQGHEILTAGSPKDLEI
ncbi:MAG: M24 family metallopeptidase [Candidatus Heimdallarchaeota archaeon]